MYIFLHILMVRVFSGVGIKGESLDSVLEQSSVDVHLRSDWLSVTWLF